MHGHAIERRIHRRQQPGNLILAPLPQHIQSPRAVLAAGPANEGFFLRASRLAMIQSES
jgi:hypothetical protein